MFALRRVGRRVGLYAGVMAMVLSVLLPVAAASAQTPPPVRAPINLMTSPLPLNVVTKPGETVTADIRVKNNSSQPEDLKVELLKFGADGDTGRPQIQERESKDVYFDWVKFSETNFRAEPNVWKTIKMTITPPKEAAFGYYFAVLFSRSNPEKPTGGQSGVEGGVASLVLLNVDAPGAKREAKAVELVASQKVYEFLPAKFSMKLRNSGNVHVSPIGNVFIKQGSKQVATLPFNDERGNILPGTNRSFEVTWDKGFPRYEETKEGSKTNRSLKWDFNELQNFRIGKYTATLVAVYDDGQRDVPVEAVVSFWVIPWRILGAALLIILFVGIGIWGIFRLLWKNIRRQASMPADDSPSADSLAAATRKDKKHAHKKSEKRAFEPNKDGKSGKPGRFEKRVTENTHAGSRQDDVVVADDTAPHAERQNDTEPSYRHAQDSRPGQGKKKHRQEKETPHSNKARKAGQAAKRSKNKKKKNKRRYE